nr:hypothetical protein [uncultured Moraxella sp.]
MLNFLSTRYRSLAAQASVWLIFTAVAGGLTFMVWVSSAVKPEVKKNQDNEISTVIDPNILLLNHNPDELNKMVQPIKFDAIIRDKRNYPKEFKDSRFIKTNLGKWTVQVMNVVQHEVITDYLANRSDRDKFNYFRIVDEDNQKRFVLTYGTFGSAQEAIGASKLIKFDLPNNVQAFPEEFKLYLSQMDEYEISPPLQDIGRDTPKSVNLSKAKSELPAPKAQETSATEEKPKESIEKSNNTNDTLAVEEKRVAKNPNAELNEAIRQNQDFSQRLPEPKPVEQKLPEPKPTGNIEKTEKPSEKKQAEKKPVEKTERQKADNNNEE